MLSVEVRWRKNMATWPIMAGRLLMTTAAQQMERHDA